MKRNSLDMNSDEVEERKKLFFQTIKTKNWGKIIGSVIVGIIFSVYFIQIYIYHNIFEDSLSNYMRIIPQFFNRYRYTMLSYSFIRERIINNNTLESFEYDYFYGNNLDLMYNDKSMDVERELTSLKLENSYFITDISNLIKVMDSETFCLSVIGDSND